MQINSIQPNINTQNNKIISHKGLDGRSIISTLANPDSLMTTVSLETCVTGGRGMNAYKRGGVDEFRERFLDDVVSALFWMKGVDMFNSVGDKFGKKFLNLPTTDFDIGKDALRTPFQNLSKDIEANNDAKTSEEIIKKLERFKFTKIIGATLLSTAVIGFIMPRINQKLTEKMMLKKQMQNEQAQNQEKSNNGYLKNNQTIDEFEKRISGNKIQSFKGLSEVSHVLENHTICKMLTNDAGIITGRTTSARNKDEGLEYLFRDVSSLFFYFASTPLIYKGLQKLTGASDITSLDPKAGRTLNNNLIEQLKNLDGTISSMTAEEFKNKTMGLLDENAQKIIEKLPFKSDVISLDELKKQISDSEIIQRAEKMSELQPEKAGEGRVLTKQQTIDVFRNGSITQPEFMKNIYKERFGDKIFDKYRYISMDKITKFRDNIDKYAQSVIDTAVKENGGIVDTKLLEKVNNKNYKLSGGFRLFAMGVSAFCLGIVIPKLQYALTEHRTGSKNAPGFREFQEKGIKN